jgi:hypothetical protein
MEQFISEALTLGSAIIAAIALGVGLGFRKLIGLFTSDESIKAEGDKIAAELEAAYVQWYKDASADGSFSKEELEHALALAKKFSTDFANGPVASIIKSYTKG